MKKWCRWTLVSGLLLVALVGLGCASSPTTALTLEPTATPRPTVTPTPTATPPPTATPVPPGSADLLAPPPTIDGHWEGRVEALGTQLETALNVTSNDAGISATIDIPQQGVDGLALSNVRYDPPKVRFEIDLGQFSALFEGEVHGETILGEFQQSGVRGSFRLERVATTVPIPATPTPVSYREEEVIFQSGEIILAGTLTLPPGDGPHPAVVLITGSGPQNRDEELFGFRIFGVIADHFTRNGIAVLRYDDRGVGASTGDVNQATSQDFAGDVVAAVELLHARQDINGAQIGLLGHSEGGIVAPLAAVASNDVAFVILMAGTGVPGHRILQAQLELIAPSEGLTQAEIAARMELQQRSFAAVRSGKGFDDLKPALRQQVLSSLENLSQEERQSISDVDQFVDTRVELSIEALRTPWIKFFLDYDPGPTLAQVRVPVLALFGELDLQVPPDINQPAINQALELAGNQDVTSVILPKANHLFQEAVTGEPSEYATLPRDFVPGFLDLMSRWVRDRVDVTVDIP